MFAEIYIQRAALLAMVPITLFLYTRYPPRRAMLVSMFACALFLPVRPWEFPGPIDISKVSIASLTNFFATFFLRAPSLLEAPVSDGRCRCSRTAPRANPDLADE